MAEIIHGTNSQIKGPFLIDRSQLEALDHILQEEWARFESEFEKTLHDAVEKEFQKERANSWNKEKNDGQLRALAKENLQKSYEFRKRRQCAITLTNGSVVILPDIAAAFREPELQDKELSGFVAGLESCGGRKCSITLGRYGTELEIEVAPKGDYFVQQTFTVLKNWQNSVRPPAWQTFWRNWSFMVWFIWLMVVSFSFQIIDRLHDSGAKSDYKHQASELIAITNGIPADKQSKAIQLLLADAYNIFPQKTDAGIPNWFFLLLFGGLVYCIALSFKPDVAIAIGRGVEKVRFWRNYSKFILITTPVFIFVAFFWPKIQTIIQSFF
jgi:hypothetical protein